MRLLFLTSGPNVPSSRFRVMQFLPKLREMGHECVVAPSRPAKYTHWPWLGWRLSLLCREWLRHFDLMRARWGKFDVVFLERELFDDSSDQMEAEFRRVAHRFVLDIDDGIFLKHPEKFARVSSFSDNVIAGNEFLAAEARRHTQNVITIPTVIDLDRYTFEATLPTSSPLVIGWTGTQSNLVYLEALRIPLERLARKYSFVLRIVTNSKGLAHVPSFDGVSTQAIPWSESTEISELKRFDIGVMPLPDDPWARYKCGFKLIQYMAIGASAVASPVGVNTEIAGQGNAALLASTPSEWETQLERLLSSPDERNRMRMSARERIANNYSLQAVFPKWLKAVLGENATLQHNQP